MEGRCYFTLLNKAYISPSDGGNPKTRNGPG